MTEHALGGKCPHHTLAIHATTYETLHVYSLKEHQPVVCLMGNYEKQLCSQKKTTNHCLHFHCKLVQNFVNILLMAEKQNFA